MVGVDAPLTNTTFGNVQSNIIVWPLKKFQLHNGVGVELRTCAATRNQIKSFKASWHVNFVSTNVINQSMDFPSKLDKNESRMFHCFFGCRRSFSVRLFVSIRKREWESKKAAPRSNIEMMQQLLETKLSAQGWEWINDTLEPSQWRHELWFTLPHPPALFQTSGICWNVLKWFALCPLFPLSTVPSLPLFFQLSLFSSPVSSSLSLSTPSITSPLFHYLLCLSPLPLFPLPYSTISSCLS